MQDRLLGWWKDPWEEVPPQPQILVASLVPAHSIQKEELEELEDRM